MLSVQVYLLHVAVFVDLMSVNLRHFRHHVVELILASWHFFLFSFFKFLTIDVILISDTQSVRSSRSISLLCHFICVILEMADADFVVTSLVTLKDVVWILHS